MGDEHYQDFNIEAQTSAKEVNTTHATYKNHTRTTIFQILGTVESENRGQLTDGEENSDDEGDDEGDDNGDDDGEDDDTQLPVTSVLLENSLGLWDKTPTAWQ
jgi:hypothetical protein